MSEQTVANIYCSNEWASPPRFWVGDPERYRPLVEEALKAFDSSSVGAVTFFQAGDYGYLADPGESGEWLIHSRFDDEGQWHGYKENLDPWQLDRVEVYRPRHGRISVSLIWAYKYNGDRSWADLYLDVPAKEQDQDAA